MSTPDEGLPPLVPTAKPATLKAPSMYRTLWGAICAGALALLSWNIDFANTPTFDEAHYIPAARLLLEDKVINTEHPPLGKWVISMGLRLAGDNAIGWRSTSVLMGVATLAAMPALMAALGFSEAWGIWALLLTLFNQLFFVQSRIAMLDSIMMPFLIWSWVYFARACFQPLSRTRRLWSLLLAGGLAGVAGAVKWIAIVSLASMGSACAIVSLRRRWGARGVSSQLKTDWHASESLENIKIGDWVIAFVAAPLVGYFIGWLPIWGIEGGWATPWEWVLAQYQAYEAQLRVVRAHPSMSQWHEWLFPSRPMWYAFESEGVSSEWVRGVICLGSPLVHWMGVIALVALMVRFVKTRNRLSGWVSWMTLGQLVCWGILPRKIHYYYYVYPSFLLLTPAIAVFFRDLTPPPWFPHKERIAFSHIKLLLPAAFLGSVIAMFCYFHPILAAEKITRNAFMHRIWIGSWI